MAIRSIRILAALVCLFIGGGLQAKPITLAYNSNALNITLPIVVAQDLGFFAAGVDEEARKLGGPDKFFTPDMRLKAVSRR